MLPFGPVEDGELLKGGCLLQRCLGFRVESLKSIETSPKYQVWLPET